MLLRIGSENELRRDGQTSQPNRDRLRIRDGKGGSRASVCRALLHTLCICVDDVEEAIRIGEYVGRIGGRAERPLRASPALQKASPRAKFLHGVPSATNDEEIAIAVHADSERLGALARSGDVNHPETISVRKENRHLPLDRVANVDSSSLIHCNSVRARDPRFLERKKRLTQRGELVNEAATRIGEVDVSYPVYGNTAGKAQFARIVAPFSPFAEEFESRRRRLRRRRLGLLRRTARAGNQEEISKAETRRTQREHRERVRETHGQIIGVKGSKSLKFKLAEGRKTIKADPKNGTCKGQQDAGATCEGGGGG